MSSFTGVRATYVVNPKVTVIAGANNGWDDWKFAGKKKTIFVSRIAEVGQLSASPNPNYKPSETVFNRCWATVKEL